MKIGILTYHRALNYGACLQAVATRVVLERLGYEVYYIDYWPDYHRDIYRLFSIRRFFDLGLRSRMKYLASSVKNIRSKKNRIKNFDLFFSQYIIPFCKPVSDNFDVIIYGSDQIWRKQPRIKSYNPVYFGYNNFTTKKHVAFSASMGILPDRQEDRLLLSRYIKSFSKVAVRENDLCDLLNNLGYTDVKVTLDPTLLLTFEQWDQLIPTRGFIKKPYLLVYGVSGVPLQMSEIQEFAHSNGWGVVVLSGDVTMADSEYHISTLGPSCFIDLIKNADFVITSSFHGLAFSIIYHKQFIATYYNNSNRAETLLESLGINNRIIDKYALIPKKLTEINYSHVDEKLVSLRSSTLQYLKSL